MKTTTTNPLRAWIDDALCAQTDPELFFPAKGMASKAAKRVCQACSVRAECLAEALQTEPTWGLRGGLSPGQRRRLAAGGDVAESPAA